MDSMVIRCLVCFSGRTGFKGSVGLSGVDVSLDGEGLGVQWTGWLGCFKGIDGLWCFNELNRQ